MNTKGLNTWPDRLMAAAVVIATLSASPRLIASPALDLARQLNQAFVEVAEEVSPAVVVITVTQKPGRSQTLDESNPLFDFLPRQFREYHRQQMGPVQSQGSGVVIREDGYLLTNSHVVDQADKIRVRFKDGKEYVAVNHWADPQSDIAVIKIDAKGLKVAKLGNSDKTRVGEFAIAIGAPFYLDYSVTFGHVSAKGRSHIIPDGAMDQDFIQTDAAINPGNSGGPLVNVNSEVIGINTLIRGMNTGIGFAVPINLAREVSDQLIDGGKFVRSWLGISMNSLKDDLEYRDLVEGVKEGVVVRGIVPDGPAAKSELRPADVITAIDGKAVTTGQELKNMVRSKKVGQPLVLDVVRNGKPIKVNVKTAAWPEDKVEVRTSRAPSDESNTAQLGLRVQTLTPELADKFDVDRKTEGVVVTDVEPGSPADRKGIEPGNVITKVDRKPVANPRDFRQAAKEADVKKGVVLVITSKTGSRFEVLKESGD
jgi:serine protease Do